MNKFIFLFLSLLSFSVFSNENVYIGSYDADTESDCNLLVALMAHGKGIATGVCSSEDESNKSSEKKFNISWRPTSDGIILTLNNIETQFTYYTDLCKQLYMKGSGAGFILTNINDQKTIQSWGYGHLLWRSPIKCQ